MWLLQDSSGSGDAIFPLDISLRKSVARRRRQRRAGSAGPAGAPAARLRLRAPGGPGAPRARVASPRLAVWQMLIAMELPQQHLRGLGRATGAGIWASAGASGAGVAGTWVSTRGDLGPGARRPASSHAAGRRTLGVGGGVCSLHEKVKAASPGLWLCTDGKGETGPKGRDAGPSEAAEDGRDYGPPAVGRDAGSFEVTRWWRRWAGGLGPYWVWPNLIRPPTAPDPGLLLPHVFCTLPQSGRWLPGLAGLALAEWTREGEGGGKGVGRRQDIFFSLSL